MTMGHFFAVAWSAKPSVIAGCCALLAGYGFAVRMRFRLRSAAWIAGVLLIALALMSPVDVLADDYLFSVHMAKHILFVLIVPALLWMGVPADPMRRMLRHRPIAAIERRIGNPAVAWIAGIGAMAVWHIPWIFTTALSHEWLHIIEHLSLLIAGTIYWWPILSPVAELRIRPVPQGAIYLFSSCLACSAIGIAITARPALYTPYAHPRDVYGILPAIREGWGISAGADQQIGGLLMWVPCCFVYVSAIMAMFARWYQEEELSNHESFAK